LQAALGAQPEAGDVIPGTGADAASCAGVRKGAANVAAIA
jgi:hypothetical protein